MDETVEGTAEVFESGFDSTNLDMYLKDIRQLPLLTADQEKELAVEIQSGSQAAMTRMVQSNLRLVVSIAKKYRGKGLEFEDLISMGNLGLFDAAIKFDPSKGFRFSTYASWWVRQSITRALMNLSRGVRLPVHVYQKVLTLHKLKRENETLTETELSQATGFSLEDVRWYLKLGMGAASLDAPVMENEEGPMVDLLESDDNVEDNIDSAKVKQEVWALLQELNPSERFVLMNRFDFSDDLTLEECGVALGITRERVRQIQNQALRKLRARLAASGKSLDYFFT